MKEILRFAVAVVFLAALGAPAPEAATTPAKSVPRVRASTLSVSLFDSGASAPMATDRGIDMADAGKGKATMGLRVSKTSVKAGDITFNVTNTSKDTIHEMIVMYLADPSQALPYIAADSKVDEDKAGDKGEVSELDPGKNGTLTVALKPGKYLLICNVAGHFMAGMWTTFEVTK